MTVPIDKCRGCRDDFYNHGGHALDGKRCWSAEDGRMVIRYRTHRDDPPGRAGAFTKVRVPSCYHGAPWYYVEKPPSFAVDVGDLTKRTPSKLNLASGSSARPKRRKLRLVYQHNHMGNCWDGRTVDEDACLDHDEPRGECSVCPTCPVCERRAS